MKKKAVYGSSYEPREEKPVNEAIQHVQQKNMDAKRIRYLGGLLREEKSQTAELQKKVRRLEDENRRLKETIIAERRELEELRAFRERRR